MKAEAIKAKAADITLAGVTIKGYQLPDNSYRVSLSQVLEAFDISRGRLNNEILGLLGVPQSAIQSLKVARGKGLRGSTNVNVYLLTTEQLNMCLGILATRGVQNAIALLVATANETWQRRFDAAFGVQKTEVNREQELREFFRELARKSYHPQLTSAMVDSVNKGNWAREVNAFKRAVGLPLVCVDNYGKAELELWNDGMSRYNCLRAMDKTHKQALQEIYRQRQDKLALVAAEEDERGSGR